MDIRLAAMDLDGTLLDGEKRVSALNTEALLDCERAGVFVVLASGRSFESVGALARSIGLKSPVISSNGARVDLSPEGGLLFLDAFSRRLAERVYAILLDSALSFACYCPGVIYQLNPSGDDARGLNRGVVRVVDTPVADGNVRRVRDPDEAFAKGLNQALKFVAFCAEPARLEALRAVLTRETPCQLSSSAPDNLEVMAPGGGKGRALAFLMGRLGIRKEQTMAFGDHTNDLDMLGAAGWPVAMGNALDAVKRDAWRVAPSCDDSGVGRVLRECVLGVNM